MRIVDKHSRVTIKIGSNVLARADGTLDVTRMSALVDQICRLRDSGIEVVLISSGAVACGRSELRSIDPAQLDKVSCRQLFSAVGQVKLMNRYSDLFGSHGVAVGQVLTMKENFSTRHHYLNQRNCMEAMLTHHVLPIVNENDTVSVTELMFTDNDELSGLVSTMMDCQALVILSNIDGIYDGDPKEPGSKLITRITVGEDCSRYVVNGGSSFGRGGMITKCRIARKVADEGVTVIIADGKRDDILTKLLSADPEDVPCTVFEPSATTASSMKRWIAHSEGFAKGAVVLNDDAVKAMRSDTVVSLLMVGVVSVNGVFEKDDLIKIQDCDGNVIGVGRTFYSSAEAKTLIGKRDCRPIVHYDYLYIE